MTPLTKASLITADDLGASPAANSAILTLVAQHKVDRVGVMIRGTISPEEIVLLKNANIKIDIHLDIPSLHYTLKLHDKTMRRGYRFLFHLLCGHISPQKIAKEWESQITLFHEKFGTIPNGISSHEHTHLFPPYFRISCMLAQKHHIPFVRCGTHGPAPRTSLISMILSILHICNKRILRSFPTLSTTRYMTSLDWITPKDLPTILRTTKTELLCHPERAEEYGIITKINELKN
ncbi:MAG: ChbG/HpnK family deacetylase [Parcubacteria group bacterium]|jgi:predicted glycoside hydrolase/deacetylase ChbG (UPF0249 family)